MDVVKMFAEMIGIGTLLGAVVVVSCDVCIESERHRLMARELHLMHRHTPRRLRPRAERPSTCRVALQRQ